MAKTNLLEYAERLEEVETEKEQLQSELEDTTDRVCYLENCTEKMYGLETQLADATSALTAVSDMLTPSNAYMLNLRPALFCHFAL